MKSHTINGMNAMFPDWFIIGQIITSSVSAAKLAK